MHVSLKTSEIFHLLSRSTKDKIFLHHHHFVLVSFQKMHLVRKLFDPLLVTALHALNRVINPTSKPVQHVQDVFRNTFPCTRFEL